MRGKDVHQGDLLTSIQTRQELRRDISETEDALAATITNVDSCAMGICHSLAASRPVSQLRVLARPRHPCRAAVSNHFGDYV